jgi:hypothetical protein
MAGCDDTRQLTEAQRVAGYENQRTGVQQAVRPFTGAPTLANLMDYINRELFPAVKSTRAKVNEVYKQVVDNAPSGNPLGYFFSTSTVNGDPTAGRLRLDQALQDFAGTIRASVFNTRLKDVSEWLVVMSGSSTDPLGVVTLSVAGDPSRFLRFDLETMTGQGDYWDLGVTVIEASHSNPFVDGAEVNVSFIPGVAAGGGAGAVVRIPGQPFYDVMARPFHAVGDGIADDTAAINAAIVAANAVPGDIYLGPRHRITAALTTITGNNIMVRGRGDFNGGSRLIGDSAAAIDCLTFTGQYSGVEDVWIVGLRAFTSGWAIRVRGGFRCRISRVVISQWCFGVEVFQSVLTYLDKVNTDDTYGVFAFWAGGAITGENHAVTFRSCTAGVAMPGTIVGVGKTWATATAYVVGNVVVANSAIWQCVTAGTSSGAGSGPSGLPTTSPSTVHTTHVIDGTVHWVFAMPAFVGFLQDSYCHTFEMIDCGTLEGLYGFSMEDSANTGTSYPQFARARNLQCDHPMSRGVRLAAGGAARFASTFVTSVFGGSGIEIGSGFSGNWEFVGGEVFGCSEAGVLVSKGDGVLDSLQIGACGSISSNTRDCIEVAAGCTRWTVVGCSGGQMFAGLVPVTRYGLSIGATCDSYTVIGNRFTGNVTGGILNTPGRASTRVVLNNTPDVTISAGSAWGLQIDASAATVPAEITGAEQGENYRCNTRQTVSASGTMDIALNDDTTILVLQLTADTTLRSLRNTATGDGRLVRIEHDSGAFTLTVAHNGATPTYSPFFNPHTADYQMRVAGVLNVRLRTGFWRPEYPGSQMRVRKNSTGTVFNRGRFNLVEGSGVTLTVADDGTNDEVDVTVAATALGLSDGDKGDVTVSGTGTVWTVDANIAKAWTGVHSFTSSTFTVATSGITAITASDDINLTALDNCTLDISNTLTLDGSAGVTLTSANRVLADAAFEIAKPLRLTGVISPTITTTPQNNWSPTGLSTANVIRITSSGVNANITGIAAQSSGTVLVIINVGANPITIANEDGSSTAANRVVHTMDAPELGQNEIFVLWYDGTTARWRVIAVAGSGNP